jgi:hypothetical protein
MDRCASKPMRSPEELWQWQFNYRKRLRKSMRLDMPPVYQVPAVLQHQFHSVRGRLTERFCLETQQNLLMPVRREVSAAGPMEFALIDMTRPGSSEWSKDWDGLLDFGWAIYRPTIQGWSPPGAGDLSVEELSHNYIALGTTYAAQAVTDVMRLIDHIDNTPDAAEPQTVVVADRATSELASWVAALDQRICGAAITLWPDHNSIEVSSSPPRLLNAREVSAPRIVLRALAPRPLLLIEEAESDPLQNIADGLKDLRDLYELCGQSDAIHTSIGSPSTPQISALACVGETHFGPLLP